MGRKILHQKDWHSTADKNPIAVLGQIKDPELSNPDSDE